jgi:toxin ParE1/3/4
MTIRWTRGATRQLAAAHAYTAADNPKSADRVVLQIAEAVKLLGAHPNAAREGRVKGSRELVIVGTPYVVAYQIKDRNTIQVLAVLHGKRRWPNSF